MAAGRAGGCARARTPGRSSSEAVVGTRGMWASAVRPLDIALLDSWPTDTARGSGTAVAVAGLAAGLRALGHRVEVVRPSGDSGGAHLGRRLAFNLTLPRRLAGRGHDLVIGIDVDGCLLSREGARSTSAAGRFAVCLKGIAADERRFETGWTRARMGLLAALEARNARNADVVLVPSAYSRRTAMDAYGLDPERVRIVPEGIDLASWRPLPSAARHLARRGKPPRILTVARQYPRKDTRTLIAAMPGVLREAPGATLHVVGGGPELPALRGQARSLGLEAAVRFMDGVSDLGAIRREYHQADVFCLPSRQEGFGIVLLEAMASGLPIVAAATGAIPEVAPHGEVALLVPPRDPDALAATLLRLLRSALLRTRLARHGLSRVERYDWPDVAARLVAAAMPKAAVAVPAAPARYSADSDSSPKGRDRA